MLASDNPKSAVIVEIYDPEELQARIDVPLRGSIAADWTAGYPDPDLLPDTKFTGEVTRIAGEADLQRNTLQAKVRLDEPDSRLRPAMLVRAAFHPVQAAPSETQTPAQVVRILPFSFRSKLSLKSRRNQPRSGSWRRIESVSGPLPLARTNARAHPSHRQPATRGPSSPPSIQQSGREPTS